MKIVKLLVIGLISAVTAACAPEVSVTDVQFGTFSGVGTGSVKFKPESSISKSDEVAYGWLIALRNPPSELKIREVISGPTGIVWDVPPGLPGVEVYDGGKTVSMSKTIANPYSPLLFHHWVISSDDPVGNYRAMLYVEGKLVHELNFVVIN